MLDLSISTRNAGVGRYRLSKRLETMLNLLRLMNYLLISLYAHEAESVDSNKRDM